MALCIGQDMFTGDSGCHDNGLLSIWGRSICSCTVSTVFLCSYFWGSFLFLFPPSDGLSFNAFVLWMTVFHCPLEVSSLMAFDMSDFCCSKIYVHFTTWHWAQGWKPRCSWIVNNLMAPYNCLYNPKCTQMLCMAKLLLSVARSSHLHNATPD